MAQLIVAVEGAEGVGKSSTCQALGRLAGGAVVPDFSPTPVGRFLADAVLVEPHVFMESELGQSLLFLADHAVRLDDLHRHPRAQVAWLERGAASKLVYQAQVLEPLLGEERALALLEPLVAAVPPEDLSVLLVADLDVLSARLVGRGEEVDDARLAFMARAQDALRARLAGVAPTIDTTLLTPDEVAAEVLVHVRRTHPAVGLPR